MSATAKDVVTPPAEDILTSTTAGDRVIRGSAWRAGANLGGAAMGVATAALLLRHLGVAESGRYVTVISLVAIPVALADVALNITGSRELALRGPRDRVLTANILGQRLATMPLAVLLVVCFAVLAGYPTRMVVGTVLAGTGLLIVALCNVLLLRLTAELRNAGLAAVDFLKQAVTLVGVAVLVVLGARLTPFFALQIAVGLAVVALIPRLVGWDAFLLPRFDRAEQRLLLHSGLPMAIALALSQIYFRVVIVLMSLIASAKETGYFGGSLRAIEAGMLIPVLIASVALPLLAAAARDDRARLRYAIEGLSKGAVIIGVLVVLLAVRLAEPVMAIIGGHAFRPAGAVLRIQVAALVFVALDQIWAAGLVALGRQRELILTNALAVAGVGIFAIALVPPLGARGGAVASVLGEALLCSLVYWRLHLSAGRVMVRSGFLLRVVAAAALAAGVLLIPGLPNVAAAVLAGALFLGVGQLIGMVPHEVIDAFALGRLLWRRAPPGP